MTLPTIPSAGNKTEHTDWFSYGDFGLPFSEFTFVLNWKNNTIGNASQAIGINISVEWDLNENDTTELTTITEMTVETAINDFAIPNQAMHVLVMDQDLLLPATDVNIALAHRFRFKFIYTCGSVLGGYSDGDKMALAIVPQNGG